MKLVIVLFLFALCEPAFAQPPMQARALVDPFRVQGGRFYDLRATVTNYMAWIAATRVPFYPANSTMERERLRNLALFDPVTHGWGKFIVSGEVKERRPDGIVIANGTIVNASDRQRFFLLKNSPFKMDHGLMTALAIPIGFSGDMAVYDYGVPVKGPPAPSQATPPAKSTNAVPVAKP